MTSAPSPANRWAGAWPDALAFAIGLGVSWGWGWNTTDLVWSLWLSSLVVGYAMIVWKLTTPLRETISGIAGDRDGLGAHLAGRAVTVGVVGVGTLFGLAFFTVHFGGFHFVHSVSWLRSSRSKSTVTRQPEAGRAWRFTRKCCGATGGSCRRR